MGHAHNGACNDSYLLIMVIEFAFEDENYNVLFKDALVLPDDHGLTEPQIEAMKKARFDAWYAVVTAPSEE